MCTTCSHADPLCFGDPMWTDGPACVLPMGHDGLCQNVNRERFAAKPGTRSDERCTDGTQDAETATPGTYTTAELLRIVRTSHGSQVRLFGVPAVKSERLHTTFIRQLSIYRDMGYFAGCDDAACDWTHHGDYADVLAAANAHRWED